MQRFQVGLNSIYIARRHRPALAPQGNCGAIAHVQIGIVAKHDRVIQQAGAWGTGRGFKAREGAPGEGPFRDDLQGGDPAAEDDDYGQSYSGPMREYRGTLARYKAVPRAHADGDAMPRPDQSILEDVVDLLARDRGVDDNRIQVEVNDGKVSLEGTTCSRRSMSRAIRLAKLVAGATAVRNRMRVHAPAK